MSDEQLSTDAGELREASAAVTPADAAEQAAGAAERATPAESVSPDSAQKLVGTIVADRYRVYELLGSGGMGSVYRAEHVHMRKQVALKVLHPEMTRLDEVVARFEREAIAAARIEHRNVAKAGDFGKLGDGSFYLVLEYIAGQSLAKLIRQGALPLDRALAITLQIADALTTAHAAGVVHRDLKPDNVMLVEGEGGAPIVKVLDFGIARVDLGGGADARSGDEGKPLTRVGTIFGTPGYMAPEQAVGEPADHRADLYAVGVMLYEMLAGRVPFEGKNAPQILASQLTSTPPPLPKAIPRGVSVLISECLVAEAEKRIPTAEQLAQRLAALWDEHVAPPLVPAEAQAPAEGADAAPQTAPPVVASAAEFLRSPRGRIALAAAAALVLVAAASVTLFGSAASAKEPPTLQASTGPKRAFKRALTAAQIAAQQARERRAAERAAQEQAQAERAAAETEESDDGSKKGGGKSRGGKKKRTIAGIYVPPPSEWF